MKHLVLTLLAFVALLCISRVKVLPGGTRAGSTGTPASSKTPASGAAELSQLHAKNLAVVRDHIGSQSGGGTAFIARSGNGRFLFTTQTAVLGLSHPQFVLWDRTRLKVGAPAAAVEHNVMSYGLEPGESTLEVMTSVDQTVSVGDDVVMLDVPNSDRPSSPPFTGKIVDLGPHLIETTPQPIYAHAGRPMIHVKTGKVIGIFGYHSAEPKDRPIAQARQIRSFSYRLDSIKRWQPVRWSDYLDDYATFEKVRTRTTNLIGLLVQFKFSERANFHASRLDDADLSTALHRYKQSTVAAGNSTERERGRETFLRDLRSCATADIEFARRRITYDLFLRMLDEDESRRRTQIEQYRPSGW